MLKSLLKYCVILLTLVAVQGWAATCCEDSSCIKVTGKASYAHTDKAYARQMAIRDALQLAVIQWGAQVRSQQQVEKFQLTRSQLTVHGKGQVRGFTILAEEEEPEEALYTVRLNVCMQPLEDACPNPFASGLKPRLVVGHLAVNQAYAVRDIRDLQAGFVSALVRKLKRDYGNVQLTDTPGFMIGRTDVPLPLDPEVVQSLQEETGAQFMLVSLLKDADLRRKPDFTGFETLDQTLEQGRRFYSYESPPNRRSLTLTWFLVDLNHARVAAQGELREQIRGDVYVGRDKPFDTAAFYQTQTGHAFARLLEALKTEIVNYLKCAPFEARILEVHNQPQRQEVLFFATKASGLREGDQLTLYRAEGNPVRMGARVLGQRTEPVGFIRIKRMEDLFAIGEVVAKKGRVEVNDWVRSW